MQVETLVFYQLGELKLEVHVFLVLVCVFLECKHNMNHDRFLLPEHIFHKKKSDQVKTTNGLSETSTSHDRPSTHLQGFKIYLELPYNNHALPVLLHAVALCCFVLKANVRKLNGNRLTDLRHRRNDPVSLN